MARIAIAIEDVNRRGGQERVVCELVKRLAPRHEIDLYCLTAADVPEDQIRVIRLRERLKFSSFLRATYFIFAASHAVASESYDIVCAQGGNMLNQNFVLAHTCQAQRLRSLRELHWPQARRSALKRLTDAIQWGVKLRCERRAMLRCRGRIIAIDDLCKRELCEAYGLQDSEVFVAYNGVDHERFNPESARPWREELRGQHGIADDAFVVLFMGGLWVEKGLVLLVEALARMEQSHARLVVVGRGDEEYFGSLAADLGVGDRVIFAGFTEHPERYFGMADAFAFLSRAEGLALVQLEAAACGLPLVLLRDYAPADLVADSESGYLVDYDAGEVAKALDSMAADPHLCAAMARRSHELSLNFSWDKQAEEIERIFLNALQIEAEGGEGSA